jgi:hypothetical protein
MSQTEPGASIKTIDILSSKYELSESSKDHLGNLLRFRVKILADDSSSMNTKSDAQGYPTRFHELKDGVELIRDIVVSVTNKPIDIYFLNRENRENVTSTEDVEQLFREAPNGHTHLITRVSQILSRIPDNEETLLIIATDGEPNDGTVAGLKKVLQAKPDYVYVSFLACTDEDNVMEMLNDIDNTVKNVDVTDDYRNEKKQILAVQGKSFPFSRGDWAMKLMLGAVIPYYDKLDEGNAIIKQYHYIIFYVIILAILIKIAML